MIKAWAIAASLALGAGPALAAGPQLQSREAEGMQPLFALAANLCVGAMRMGNSLPLRMLDHLGESPSLGMANRLYADADRQIEVMLAGSSPGQPETPPILCLAQPRQAMGAAKKDALRDWMAAEFTRMAEADDVEAFTHMGTSTFTRIIYWCEGGERLVMAVTQSDAEAELRLGITRSLPGNADAECPGGEG